MKIHLTQTIAGHRSIAMIKAPKRFFEDYLSYLLARANFVIYKEFDVEVRAAGLSSLEWRVLATLADSDGLTIGEMASIVLAKQPTLTKLVDRMAASGLLEKHDDSNDLRRTLVFETAKGRKRVRPLLDKAKAHEQAALKPFAARDVEALKGILRSLSESGNVCSEKGEVR